MSSDKPPNQEDACAALGEASRDFCRLLDEWWRRQCAALPPDLQRVMTSNLDQSKAMVDLVCDQAMERSGGEAGAGQGQPAGGFGLFQPVVDACRRCEAGLIGSAAEHGADAEALTEYRRAAEAYFNEFVHINTEIVRRVQARLGAADAPDDFLRLHAVVMDEAESAYLERVSGDAFAARQAAFINALFRLRKRKGPARVERPEDTP